MCVPFTTLKVKAGEAPVTLMPSATGSGLMVTSISSLAVQPLASVILTEYTPAAATFIDCEASPVLQVYTEPGLPPFNTKVLPSQIAVSLPRDTSGGILIVTLIVSAARQPVLFVTTT
ncbi:hypothetical protein D3C80_998060 [compost metagenome]